MAFSIEHVQRKPAGWKVRTIVPKRSRHRVRVAFPPGARRKGSGQVVEILHPAEEKKPQCKISRQARENPGELLIFGNPHGRRVPRTAGGGRAGHQPGCPCFACRHARGEKVNRGRAKRNSKLAEKRVARERASRIRAARLNPKAFAGWSYFTKQEKNFMRSIHMSAPKSEEDVRAYKETLKKIDEINARGSQNPVHMQVRFDPAIKKFLASIYDPKFGNLYATGYTKKQAAHALHEEVRRAKRTGSWRNPKRANPRRRRGDRNPSDIDQAVTLYASFHGRDPKTIVEKHVSAATRLDYTALGDLEYLITKTPLGKKAKFEFPGDGVMLASSPDGKQLYCIGGNQNLLPLLDKDSQQKDFIDLGDCIEVQYLSRKVHADFRPVSYYHKFGEINGAPPRLMFDKLKKQIFFVGGEYFIDTSKGVSPGIEN